MSYAQPLVDCSHRGEEFAGRHPWVLGQASSVQDSINRTAGTIAGTIAGGVIGLGVGLVGLGAIAYYMYRRSRRPSRNRRGSR